MSRHVSFLRRSSRDRASGQALIEFALCLPILVLLAFGSFSISQLLERYLTVLQLVRNSGNMYSRSVDFSLVQNKQLLLEASNGLAMTLNGGNGVVYLSTVEVADTGSNIGSPVVTHRIVIGNPTLAISEIGTPSNVQASGEVVNYEDDPAAVANVAGSLTLVVGDIAYVVEAFHDPVDIPVVQQLMGAQQLAAKAYY